MSDLTLARTVRFTPYRKGHGPSFTLRMFYTGMLGEYGKQAIGYRLVSQGKVIFEGRDYYAHCDAASNAAVEGIMGFLTLKPGDTDPEYFAKYTPEQTAFAEQHAEHLGYEVSHRFQCTECGACIDEDGNACCKPRVTSALHSHSDTFCPVCVAPGAGCSFV